MKRSLGTLILSICLSYGVAAQQLMLEHEGVRVHSTELSPKIPGVTTKEVYDITDSGCTALMISGAGATTGFWEFDKNFNVTQQTPGNSGIALITKPKKGENPYGFVSFGHQFYFLRGTTDYAKKENQLILYRISKEPTMEPEAIVLSTISGEGFYDNMNYSGLTMKRSDDGTKLMIAFKLGHDRSKSGNLSYRFRIIVLNENMDKLWESDIKFIDPAGSIDVGGVGSLYGYSASAFEINNNGNVFCWADLDRGSDSPDSDRHRLKLYRMDGATVSTTTIKRPPSVTEVKAAMHNDRMVIVAPYTAEGGLPFDLMKRDDKTGGFEFIEWNGIEGSEVERTKIPLTVEHLSKNATTKQIELWKKSVDSGKKPLAESRLVCAQVNILEEGSILITAISGLSNALIYRGMQDANINDIHVFRLNEKKELVFSDRVPLYHLASVVGSGFESVVVGKKLFLLFNDIPLNIGRDWSAQGPEKFFGSDGQLSLVEMDLYDQTRPHVRKAVWTQREVGANFKLGSTAWKPQTNEIGYFYLQGARDKQRIVRFTLQ